MPVYEDVLFYCRNISNTCITTLHVRVYMNDGHIIKSQSALHCPPLHYLFVKLFVFKLFKHGLM